MKEKSSKTTHTQTNTNKQKQNNSNQSGQTPPKKPSCRSLLQQKLPLLWWLHSVWLLSEAIANTRLRGHQRSERLEKAKKKEALGALAKSFKERCLWKPLRLGISFVFTNLLTKPFCVLRGLFLGSPIANREFKTHKDTRNQLADSPAFCPENPVDRSSLSRKLSIRRKPIAV